MLPAVTRIFTRGALAAAIALPLSLASVAPAQALGKQERAFLQGVAATLLIDAILDESRKQQKAQRRAYQSAPQHYYAAQPTYQPVSSSIYRTPAAEIFNAHGATDRRRIQQRLAAMGYYNRGIDGSFGPGTYEAVAAYARDTGQSEALRSRNGMMGLYDGLIY